MYIILSSQQHATTNKNKQKKRRQEMMVDDTLLGRSNHTTLARARKSLSFAHKRSTPAGRKTTMEGVWLALILALLSTGGGVTARRIQGRYVSVRVNSGTDCSVIDAPYSAKGDGKTVTTEAIQKALDDSSCGRVVIPKPGVFLTFGLRLTRSNMELHIEKGATLLVSNDRKSWPGQSNIIDANNVNNIAITGGGTIDGQGLEWWQHRDDFRPHMVQFTNVQHALLTETLYLNSPNHVLELFCDYCELAYVKVLAPPSTGDCEKENLCSHNTDAVDVHGTPFYIHNVNFTTGDDNVAVHANNTLVENSYFGSGHGASIGSLCGDYLTNITFRNISFHETTTGARIKTDANCTGHVSYVEYKDLTMHDVRQAISVSQHYHDPSGSGHSKFLIDNLVFKNIMVTKSPKRRGKVHWLVAKAISTTTIPWYSLIATLTLMEQIVM